MNAFKLHYKELCFQRVTVAKTMELGREVIQEAQDCAVSTGEHESLSNHRLSSLALLFH
jgi:hypothetical protein